MKGLVFYLNSRGERKSIINHVHQEYLKGMVITSCYFHKRFLYHIYYDIKNIKEYSQYPPLLDGVRLA